MDFYEDALGLPVDKGDGPWAEVDANGLRIGLNGREPRGARARGDPVVTFQPEGSLEDTIEDLSSTLASTLHSKPRRLAFP